MRVAVTGGGGHLGTLVLRRLAREPGIDSIVSLDTRPGVVADSKVSHVIADITEPELTRHLTGTQVLVHMAFVVGRAMGRALYEQINVEGSKNVFRAAAAAGVEHVVYTSSISAYGIVPGHPERIDEDTPRRYQPEFPYAAAKFKVEEFLDGFEPQHPALGITRLRPGPAMGVSMEPSFAQGIRRRRVIDRGDVPKFWVWDEDVADAVALAIARRARGAFLLVPSRAITAREVAAIGSFRPLWAPIWLLRLHFALASRVRRLLGIPGLDPSWVTAINVPLSFSGEKARRVLGWTPRCETAADVVRMCDDTVPYHAHRSIRRFLRWARIAVSRREIDQAPAPACASLHLSCLGRGGCDLAFLRSGDGLVVSESIPRPPAAVVRLWDRDVVALLETREDCGAAIAERALLLEGDPGGPAFLAWLIDAYRRADARRSLSWRIAALVTR